MATKVDTSGPLGPLTIGTTLITSDPSLGSDPVIVTADPLTVVLLSNIIVSKGATLIIKSIGVVALSTITVKTGGIVELGSGLAAAAISSFTFGTGGGTLILDHGVDLSVLSAINGFGAGAVIDDAGITAESFTSSYDPGLLGGATTLTLYGTADHTGASIGTVVLNGGDFTKEIAISSDSNGGTYIGFTCFLAGTRLATPDGERTVETLAIGDLVLNAKGQARPLVWVGHQHATHADRDACPVRIRAGAFSPDVPRRDLLVTPEHCIYIDGHLLPARMLVNGSSIVIEENMIEFDFYHVEFEDHDLLLAEGLTTESYLDTGNRQNFDQGPIYSLFAPPAKNWETHGAAPLGTDRAVAEPIWKALCDRALSQGFGPVTEGPALTNDSDTRLRTETGALLKATSVVEGRHCFMVPAGTRSLRLTSRASRPSDVIGPFADDRRSLGLLVGKMAMSNEHTQLVVDLHLRQGNLSGWLPGDGSTSRWTDGNAMLPIAPEMLDTGGLLDIQILSAGPYCVENPTVEKTMFAAAA